MRHATRGKAKRFVAWLGTLAVVTTVGIASLSIATSAPAAAHTGDLQAAAACDAETGTYKVTYTLSLRNVPGGQTGSTKWHVGGSKFTNGWNESSFSWEGGPQAVSGNGTVTIAQDLPGTTVGNGPWVYAFTKWSPDGYTVKSDTRIEGLKGNCVKTPPPFSHYAPPTCEGLTVTYPENIPAGQAKDVNIRVKNLSSGEVQTFNFRNNDGTYSGTQTFNVKDHPSWPGWTWFEYQWTQVAGSNYHWEGSVSCGEKPQPPKPEPLTGHDVVEQPQCLAQGGGTINITTTSWTQQPRWNANLWIWDGYEAKVYGDPVLTTRPATSDECPNTIIVVEPPEPVFRDLCGTEEDFISAPLSVEGQYTVTPTKDGNKGRVVYEALKGYNFPEDFRTIWTYTFTDDPCVTDPPTEEPPTTPPVTEPPTTPPVNPPVTEPPTTTPPTETPKTTPPTTATPTPSPSKAAVIVKVNKTKTPPSASKVTLAETGADDSVVWGGIIALALMALGSGTILAVRRRVAQGS